jgi:hypothetical protein
MESVDQHQIFQEKRKGKNRPGRAGRRRRAKLRDIQVAEERLFAGESIEVEIKTSVPTDRSKTWPGVLERRQTSFSEEDAAALVSQLGYVPGNAIGVAARAQTVPSLPLSDNVPIVLKLYPLAIRDAFAGGKSDGRKFKGRKRMKPSSFDCNDTTDSPIDSIHPNASAKAEIPLLEPFPTQYWLTHPILRTLTSKLELTDNVRIMEQRLQSDPNALESMIRAHQAYGCERWECLTDDDLKLVQERKWEPALDLRRGVAGISRHTTIKCLHAHLAHYLSGGRGSKDNIVGRWVLEAIIEMLREKEATTNTKRVKTLNATEP